MQNSKTLLKLVSFHSFIVSLVFQSIFQSSAVISSTLVLSSIYSSSSLASDVVPEITVENPNINHYQQNNVDIIETVKSNESGLSHNKFIDFNAIEREKVINNSANTGNSQLAGEVAGNSNFEGNTNFEASKILFEVSGSSSRLEKNIEIFGSKADFILANAKGIMCNGCGFINTSNVSFVTGSVDTINGNNIKYLIDSNAQDSRILIGNEGVTFYGSNNNDNVDFNLIARAVRIAGELKVDNSYFNNVVVNNLNIKTGVGEFNSGVNGGSYETNYQNSDANNVVDAGSSDDSNANQGFAVVIDSTALGGTRPNQIAIIATELGAGVKNDANLINDLSTFTINANGNIVNNGNVSAINNISLNSTNNISNAANLTAANITSNSSNFSNSGNLSATTDVEIETTNDITNSGSIIGNSSKTLSATNNITNSGTISGSSTSLSASTITNNNQITSTSTTTLNSTNNISNSGSISGSTTNLNALNITNNLSSIISGSSSTSLTATNNILNSGSISGSSTSLSGSSITNNLNSTISAINGNLILSATATNITNSGTLSSSLLTSLTANSGNISSSGTITTNSFSANSTNFSNSGSLSASSTASITATNDILNSGSIIGNSSKTLSATNNITNSGTISGSTTNLTANSGTITNSNSGIISGSTTNLSALNITNNNQITGSNTTLNATNNITNSGTISGNSTSLSALNITNNSNSTISSSSGNLTLNLTGNLVNEAHLVSAANLIILGSGTFVNNANGSRLVAGNSGSIQITAKKLTNNQNLDLKGGFLTLSDEEGQGLLNNATITSSVSDLTISGAMQNNGILESSNNHNIVLNSLTGEMKNYGQIKSVQDGNIILNSLAGIITNFGQIKTDNELQVSGNVTNKNIIARIDDSISNDISDIKELKIKILNGTLTNDVSGQIITNNYLVIDGNNNVGNLTNLGLIRSNRLSDVNDFADNDVVNINNLNLLTNSGIIDASENLTITATEIDNNNSGLLFAGFDAILNVDKLTNQNANIISSSGDIKIQKEIITNLDGTETYQKANEVNNLGGQIKTLRSKVDAPLFNEEDVARVVEQYAKEALTTNKFSASELTNRIFALRGFLKDSNLSIEEQLNQSVSGNIRINAVSLNNNQNALISSNNYITINADNITNDNNSVLASANYFDINTNNLNNQNNAQIFAANVLNIKAENSDDINNQITNSGLIRGSSVYLNTAKLTNNSSTTSNLNSVFGQEFAANDNSFLANNLFVVNDSGNFLVSINKDTAESTQNSENLETFFSEIAFDYQNSSSKILGDDIYLDNYIGNLIQDKTQSRYLTFEATSDSSQLTSFLNSTKTQMQNLGIEFGSELTQNQKANLTDPFIAFNRQDVFVKDGNIYQTQIAGSSLRSVYIPTIITPNETTTNQATSTIATQTANTLLARNETVINASREFNNRSNIKASTIIIETENFLSETSSQELALDKNGNLTYVAKANSNKATIEADDVVIAAKNNFKNNNADIKAKNNLIIEAGNNFNVGDNLASNDVNLSSNFTAQNIAITANNADINKLNTSSNNLSLDIKNNFALANSNIESDNLYLSNLAGSAKVDNSNIKTNSDLAINTLGNVDINQSNIDANGLVISSGNDLSLDNSNINSSYLIATSANNTSIDKSNITTSNLVFDINNNFSLANSNIESDNLYLSNLAGSAKVDNSNIKTNSDLAINALGNVDINQSNINSAGLEITSGNDINLVDNIINANGLVIESGNDLTVDNSNLNSSSYLITTSANNTNINSSELNSNQLAIQSGNNVNIDNSNIANNSYSQITAKGDFNLNSSNVNSGSLIIDSGSDVKINSSNINSGDSIISAGNNFDLNSSNINSDSLSIDSKGVVNINKTNIDATNYLQVSATKDLNLTDNNIYASNFASFSAGKNANLIGNNLSSDGVLQISAKENLNILTRQETIKTSAVNQFNRTTQNISSTSVINSGFNSLSGSDVVLSSGNNTNIIAANIKADNILQISAGGDLNIENATDTKTTTTNSATQYDEVFRIKKRRYGVRTLTAYDSNTSTESSEIASSLTGSAVLLSSGKDTNIKNSNINADDLAIDARNNANINKSDISANQLQIDAKNNLNLNNNNINSGDFTNLSAGKNANLTANNINSGNIYLASGNNLSITNNKINTNNLIATSAGQITFKQNNSKTTGTLALVNDNQTASQILASNQQNNNETNEEQSVSLSSQTNTKNTANSITTASNADIIFEAGTTESSLNDLILSTSADIINHGSLIAGGDISLSATNITNSKVATTTKNRHGFTTTLSGEALIQAEGSVFLKATNDINNNAGTIIARTGDITLIAGGNVNIGSMQTRDLYADGGRKWYYKHDIITNQGSNISAGNNVIIKAGNNETAQNNNSLGNINITGSNLTSGNDATTANVNGGNIIMNASNNINITSSVDSRLDVRHHKKHRFSSYSETNNSSTLTAGNNSSNTTNNQGGGVYLNKLNISETDGSISTKSLIDNSLNDISNNVNIAAGKIKAKSDVYISADKDINITSAQDISRSVQSFKSKKRSSRSEVETITNVKSEIESGGDLVLDAGGDANIKGADLSANVNTQITASNNINIESVVDSYYSFSESSKKGSFGRRSSNSKTVENSTNIQSEINAGENLTLTSGNDINVVASDLTAGLGDIDIVATNELNIVSAADTKNTKTESKKRGITVKKTSTNIEEIITNVSSNLVAANDINITSGSDTNIIASNLSGKRGNIIVGSYLDTNPISSTYNQVIINENANLNILNGVDSVYKFSETTKVKTGLSLENALMTAAMVAAVVASGGAASGLVIAAAAGGAGAIGAINVQKTTNTTKTLDETIIASNLFFEQDLNLITANNTVIQASNIKTGTDTSITNLSQKDLNITTGGNLALLSATETHSKSHKLKDKGNYFMKNGDSGSIDTNIVNTQINNANGQGNLNLNVGENILVSYNNKNGEEITNPDNFTTGLNGSVLDKDFSNNNNLSYLNNLDNSKTLYQGLDEIHHSWSQTTRGLTEAGSAVVAITATALTAGAIDPGTSLALIGTTAGASTVATTASITAINSGMNANGDLFKQLETISKDTAKATTSKETAKNALIASSTAVLTAGLTNYINTGSFTTAATASPITNQGIITNFKTSSTQVATQTAVSSAVQSAVNGDSLADSLKDSIKTAAIQTVAKVAANEIGNSYKTGEISKPTQLALHATLGATTAKLSGSDALSGAVSGVIGELSAEAINNLGADRRTSIDFAKITSAIASNTIGGLTGESDSEMANNAWVGSRIGGNAAENNALQLKGQKVAGNKNHLTIVHTPEPDEQDNYANKEGYVQDKESGLWIRTWGAGGSLGAVGELVSENNRPRDADLSIKNYISPNLVLPNQELYYVDLLNNLDKNYQDNLRYNLFPDSNSSYGYNSNSYVSGLLTSADILPPSIPDKKISYQWQGWEYDKSPSVNINYTLPYQVPGYDKPVPSQYFKTNEKRSE